MVSTIWRPDVESFDPGVAPGEPVAVAYVKQALRVETADEDALFASWIADARERVEAATNRLLVARPVVWRFSGFPPRAEQMLELPGGHVPAIASVAYVDAAGVTRTLTSAAWRLDAHRRHAPARLGLAFGETWPATRAEADAVTVSYTAGWPDDGASPPDYGANVPDAIKTAICRLVGEDDNQRTAAVYGTSVATAPFGVEDKLAPWRLRRVG